MSKRKYAEYAGNNEQDIKLAFKNSLDSDEEDEEAATENHNIMTPREMQDNFIRPLARDDGDDEVSVDVNNIRESGVVNDPYAPGDNVGFTAFNMKEEMEEGHFDKEGHYHWKKGKEIRDNWLDEIDQVQIKSGCNPKGSGDNDSDDEQDYLFDPNPIYVQIFEYLQPQETITKALRRLGKGMKLQTTAERWKRKKNPSAYKEDDVKSTTITKLTELANVILTRTGNMDIYEESYEKIKMIVDNFKKSTQPCNKEAELDMYADDFDEKEKNLKQCTAADKDKKDMPPPQVPSTVGSSKEQVSKTDGLVCWELKWSQNENAEITGPHSSQKMQDWSREGYFKKGAWVRRVGQQGEFFNASRIDFELYCE